MRIRRIIRSASAQQGKVMGSMLISNRVITSRTSRQRSCNQMVGCLLCSTAMDIEQVVVWSLVVVRIANKLKYHNTSQIHSRRKINELI